MELAPSVVSLLGASSHRPSNIRLVAGNSGRPPDRPESQGDGRGAAGPRAGGLDRRAARGTAPGARTAGDRRRARQARGAGQVDDQQASHRVDRSAAGVDTRKGGSQTIEQAADKLHDSVGDTEHQDSVEARLAPGGDLVGRPEAESRRSSAKSTGCPASSRGPASTRRRRPCGYPPISDSPARSGPAGSSGEAPGGPQAARRGRSHLQPPGGLALVVAPSSTRTSTRIRPRSPTTSCTATPRAGCVSASRAEAPQERRGARTAAGPSTLWRSG